MTTEDPIYERVQVFSRNTDRLCIAGIQRTFLIGYNRAARLMEAMIDDGIVESFDTGYGGIGYRLKKSEA